MSASGLGTVKIAKTLTQEKVPAFGRAPWSRVYLDCILDDRRALGELQLRKGGEPDGEPVMYYPPAVTEEQWLLARAGKNSRYCGNKQVRKGKYADLFVGLLHDARGGGSYYVGTRTYKGRHTRILVNTNGTVGRTKMQSFPLATFERAMLAMLREIDPGELLSGENEKADELVVLSAKLEQLNNYEAELVAAVGPGNLTLLAPKLAAAQAEKRELVAALEKAKERAARPLSGAWGETQSLLSVLDAAPDPEEARLRLRAVLRRIVDGIWLLVVPRGQYRLCAAQIVFAGGKHHRNYLIMHQQPTSHGKGRGVDNWWARSLASVAKPGTLDLRDRAHVKQLEALLTRVDLSNLDG
jgi:hypothetical protein